MVNGEMDLREVQLSAQISFHCKCTQCYAKTMVTKNPLKKLLEVQKPFLEKISSRRRQNGRWILGASESSIKFLKMGCDGILWSALRAGFLRIKNRRDGLPKVRTTVGRKRKRLPSQPQKFDGGFRGRSSLEIWG